MGIRVLLENRHVFQPFWDWQNGWLAEAEYERQFDGARRAVERALGAGDTITILQIVFDRLYTPRVRPRAGCLPGSRIGGPWRSR